MKWAKSWPLCEFFWFYKAFQRTSSQHSICKQNLTPVSSPFFLPAASSPPPAVKLRGEADGQTKVYFSCYVSGGTGTLALDLSPPHPYGAQTTRFPYNCHFHSQGASLHREWKMLQTFLDPCLFVCYFPPSP